MRRAGGFAAALALAAVLAIAPGRHACAQSAPAAAPAPAAAADDASAVAEKIQNPVSNLTILPLQNNTNLGVGPHKGTQDVLNVQPVIPIPLNQDWEIVTRTVLPLTWSPSALPGASVPFGTGPMTVTAFVSPRNATGEWTWRIGPIVQAPTISSRTLGSNVWGAGPAVVVVRTVHPWVYGVLANNVVSFGGTQGANGSRYNLLTIEPLVNYNFAGGWFVGTVPIITANWAGAGEKWTVPLGAQVGRLIMLGGKLPLNLLVGAYYNAVRPQYGATWQLRSQAAIVF